MDPMAGLSIYNVPPSPPLWDKVGVFYVSLCAIWTTLVIAGMLFCWVNRHLPILRIRGLPLSFTAIIFLHMYWIMGQITYPVGRTLPVVLAYDIQYFFMGIWLPLGIAVFHASNSRFLHVAKLQKQFTAPTLRSKAGCNGGKSSWLCRLRNMDYTKRILIFIGIGMILQVLLTVGMWLACRKYHPTFGIPGTEIRGKTLPKQLIDLGRGWEWWPTVLWQAIWAWIVAPMLIWRAWSIRDTMGWRAQTIGCCLSNLHATPMFMIASYVPVFEKVNAYFTPSQWIHLSVMMFEIFAVFVPVFQVVKLWILSKKAVDSNAKWETESQVSTLRASTSADGKHSPSSLIEKGQLPVYLDESMGDQLLTMNALEAVLSENPEPLQEFSALSDFSGENIAFLTRISSWKSSWAGTMEKEKRLDMFNVGMDIYIDFISPRDAEFPLNLSSPDLKYLEEIFEKPTRIICGEARINAALPFETEPMTGTGGGYGKTGAKAKYIGDIPEEFNLDVFDRAQNHVKYLVLTNTWPKFVKEMQSRRRSTESRGSEFTAGSNTTLASKVTSFIYSLF